LSDFLSKINPFFKFVFIIVFSTVLSFTRSIWINIGVFGICIFLILIGTKLKQYVKAIKFLLPVSFFAFGLFMTGLHFGSDTTSDFGRITLDSTQTGMNMAARFFAFAGLGLVFSLTTEPHDLIKSMRRDAKLPRKFAYGMLCAVNLFPYIKNEYKHAQLAFQVRGVRVGLFSLKPIFSMLVNCFRWSEMLSIAMFSKGFYEE